MASVEPRHYVLLRNGRVITCFQLSCQGAYSVVAAIAERSKEPVEILVVSRDAADASLINECSLHVWKPVSAKDGALVKSKSA